MRIGIDLGGTKIEAIALAADGGVLQRRRIDAPQGDYGRSLAAIVGLVGDLERETAATGTVGVGIPGAISPATGLVKNANSTWLIGHPLHDDLSRALDRPVRLANDANCFALSEATDGAAAGAPIVFGVILGTGTGGGLVIDGRIIEGCNLIAGEWGHNPLPAPADDERPGPPCYCGRRGCIETFLSGPALRRDHRAATGEDRLAVEIAARADAGDAGAMASLARYEDRLSRALASVINIVDPHVIVLGGGLSNITRLYANVPARWAPHVFSDQVATRLVRAKHGDASGVRGAAWLWENESSRSSR
ncbi:MAG: ROK family protein [Vicinamibacterales bacterium]